jgi:glyoxylase-like metal-dependent hydrolase (beta-lactamase superfamily II)
MIVKLIPVTGFQQNCALCICPETNAAAVIDPGGEPDRIEAAIAAAGATLEKIFVTHAHVDHASAVAELARRAGVPIEGPHREDQFWIDLLPHQAAQYGMPPAETFVPDRWLEDADRCQFGAIEFEVLHTPGHTPGHVVFFCAEDHVAFVGDVLFMGSIGRTDFPRGDYDTLIRSIQTKLLPLGENVTFHCGHGPSSTLGHEARTNPFLLDPDRYRGLV